MMRKIRTIRDNWRKIKRLREIVNLLEKTAAFNAASVPVPRLRNAVAADLQEFINENSGIRINTRSARKFVGSMRA